MLTREECEGIAQSFPRWRLRWLGLWLLVRPHGAMAAYLQGMDRAMERAAGDGSLRELADEIEAKVRGADRG